LQFPIIREQRVLMASVRYLLTRGAFPYNFSVARGQGINTEEGIAEISEIFQSSKIRPQFSAHGPDLEAFSETEWWRVECKGAGDVRSQTKRNSFDRALASVVSYFEEAPYPFQDNSNELQLFLGLALPASPEYLHELRRRVRSPLRKRLNLWILLYDPSDDSIKATPPDDDV
jgi:hypothetical protein